VDTIASKVAVYSAAFLAGDVASWILTQSDGSQGATLMVCAAMARSFTRDAVFASDVPWEKVWATKLSPSEARYLLDLFNLEVKGHQGDEPYEDYDVAYLADIAKRIANGSLIEHEEEIEASAETLLGELAEIYPSVGSYAPTEGKPEPLTITAEIDDRIIALEEVEAEDDGGEDVAEHEEGDQP
jgi:hypothetical protein